MRAFLSRIPHATGFVGAGLAADAAGRLSEPLFATELAGIYDTLFLRKRRDRAVH